MPTRPSGRRVEWYKDVHGKWRWTQFGQNGRIVQASSESFDDLGNAKTNFRRGLEDAMACVEDDELYVKDTATLTFTKTHLG